MRLDSSREHDVIRLQFAFCEDIGLIKLVILLKPYVTHCFTRVTTAEQDWLTDGLIICSVLSHCRGHTLWNIRVRRWIVKHLRRPSLGRNPRGEDFSIEWLFHEFSLIDWLRRHLTFILRIALRSMADVALIRR